VLPVDLRSVAVSEEAGKAGDPFEEVEAADVEPEVPLGVSTLALGDVATPVAAPGGPSATREPVEPADVAVAPAAVATGVPSAVAPRLASRDGRAERK
jgi:hypothetical protein